MEPVEKIVRAGRAAGARSSGRRRSARREPRRKGGATIRSTPCSRWSIATRGRRRDHRRGARVRLFIWLLPLALVAVAGLGSPPMRRRNPPETLRGRSGSRVRLRVRRRAAKGPALVRPDRQSRSSSTRVLRALIGAHRLIWIDLRGAPGSRRWSRLALLGLLLCFPIGPRSRRRPSLVDGPGILVSLVAACRSPPSGC